MSDTRGIISNLSSAQPEAPANLAPILVNQQADIDAEINPLPPILVNQQANFDVEINPLPPVLVNQQEILNPGIAPEPVPRSPSPQGRRGG